MITNDYDTLVLSGGSVKGLLLLGSLQYISEQNILKNITKFIGTSVGSLCSYLLALGYEPLEIITYICTNRILERMKHFNILAMVHGEGATSFSYINEILEILTIDKCGRLFTLKDMYDTLGKEFICITYNMTTDKQEVLSYKTHPDLPCLIALRMSCNLPFIFDNFKYNHNFYVDGGFSNNFPIEIGDEIGNKIIGITTSTTGKNFDVDTKLSTIEYIYKLVSIPVRQIMLNKMDNLSDNCHVISLDPGDTQIFDFNISTKRKMEMFSDGYRQMKEKLN